MELDPAATAWLLTCTALVLLMTPGLAIFYGGMVRTTGVLNMIMMSFISIPLVTVAWLLVGYSLAFSEGSTGGLVGGLSHVGMRGIGPETLHGSVPELLYATFQLSFAIITAALVSGAIADRAKFAAWMRPHNLPFVLLGVGLLWFGWFGFNAGSALAANGIASAVFLNTLVAGCLGMLGWLSVEQIRDGKPTTFGAASGVVAGLVAITPSCGTVTTFGAAVVGLTAGIVCAFAIGLKFKLNYDDSLDVVGVHFVGGVVGVLLIGLLATSVMTGGAQGLFFGGGFGQLSKQVLAAVVVAAYAFGVTFVLAKLIDRVMGFRLSEEDEASGVDFAQHAETAYAEGVHGHQQVRRPLFGDRDALRRPGNDEDA